MDPLAVVRRRLHEQRLAGEPFETPVEAVRWLGAMQAQEFAEAKWAIAERVRDCTEADVEEAFARGDFLRTHVMRPTWHFVAAEDLRWLLRLTAPRVHAANPYGQLELDEATLRRGADVLVRALEDGEALTRKELAKPLERVGITAAGARLAYVFMYAELEALICNGPRRGKQHTYMLLEHRVPGAPDLSRDEALAELTRRYFRSHGPATAKDCSWWSGLTLTQVREGLAMVKDELESETDGEGRTWHWGAGSRAQAGPTGGYLLSTYDESVIAYQDLRFAFAGQPPRQGLFERPIVIDGRTVGSWKRRAGSKEIKIELALFASLDGAAREALDAVAERYAGFAGLPVQLA
jgi:Winged helix DNA-binding domain